MKIRERVLSAVCGLEFTLSFIWLVIGVIFERKDRELLGLSPVLVCCLFVYFMFQAVFQCWSLYKRYVYDYRGLIIITLLLTAGSAFFGVFAVTFITPTAEARAVSAVVVVSLIGIAFVRIYLPQGKKSFMRKNMVFCPWVLHSFDAALSFRIYSSKFR